MIKELNDENYLLYLDNINDPIFVEFYAPWCSYCRKMGPSIEQAVENYTGKVKFASVNTDECPEMCEEYRIKGLPTFLIFRPDNSVKRRSGYMDMQDLERWIDLNI